MVVTAYFKIKDVCFKAVVEGDKIMRLDFAKQTNAVVGQAARIAGKKEESKVIKSLKRDLEDYFNGKNVKFSYKLDLSGYPEFYKLVWKGAQKIPFGQVWSYKKLACKIKKNNAFRAAGLALGKNPVIILIPCHRVIKSDGSLGGFSSGLHYKKKLLKIEGIRG